MKVSTVMGSKPRYEIDEITRKLTARIESLADHLLSSGHKHGKQWICGDPYNTAPKKHGGSFHLNLRGDRTGQWYDFTSGEHGDLLDLVRASFNFSLPEAIDWSAKWLGLDTGKPRPAPPPQPAKPEKSDEERIAEGRAIWNNATAAPGTLVETYLRSRAIVIPIPPSIRYAGALKHDFTGTFHPVMVCAVQGPDGQITAVHKTYLREDGTGKVGLSKPKLCRGVIREGAIRLGPVRSKFSIAEGVETALSVMQSCPDRTMWAAISASGFRTVILPPGANDVVICADRGEAGEHAARAAAERFHDEGRRVRVAFPPEPHDDFNDVLMAQTRCSVEIGNAR